MRSLFPTTKGAPGWEELPSSAPGALRWGTQRGFDAPLVAGLGEDVKGRWKEPIAPPGKEMQMDRLLARKLRTGIIVRMPKNRLKAVGPVMGDTKADGSLRLIYDAREANKLFVKPFKTPQMSISTLGEVETRYGRRAMSFDIKSMFESLGLSRRIWSYFGFIWKGKTYAYTRCPQGWSHSMRMAWLVMKRLKLELEEAFPGVKMYFYVDDALILLDPEFLYLAERVRHWITAWTEQHGMVIAESKSQWKPAKDIRFLGWDINVEEVTLSIPSDVMAKVLGSLSDFRSGLVEGGRMDVYEAMSVLGKVLSLHPRVLGIKMLVGPLLKVCSRVGTKWNWSKRLWITTDALVLGEWTRALRAMTRMLRASREAMPIRQRPSRVQVGDDGPTIMGASDAAGGEGGWGYWLRQGDQVVERAGHFTEDHKIAERELRAFWWMLRRAGRWKLEPGSVIQLATDSRVVFGWVNKLRTGQPRAVPVLMRIAITMESLLKRRIRLSLVWISSKDNCWADALSRRKKLP